MIKRYLKYLHPYWHTSLEAGILLAFSVLLNLPLPLLTMYIIDSVLVEGNLSLLNILVIALLLIHIFNVPIGLLQRYLLEKFRYRVLFDLHLDMFEHIHSLPISFFHSYGTGYLMSRMTSDISAVQGLMADTILGLLKDMITLLVGITLLFVLHWKLALFSLLLLPFFVAAVSLNSNRLRPLSKELQEKNALLSKQLQEVFSGIFTTKIFAAEKTVALGFVSKMHELVLSAVRLAMTGAVLGSIVSFIGSLGPLVVLWYGGAEIIKGNLTLGQFVAFNSFLSYLFGPTQGLMNFGLNVQKSLGALERVFEIMDKPKEIYGSKLNYLRGKPLATEGWVGKVEFKNVSFHYESKKQVLNNINLTIEPGSMVALVGRSGAGKTTLANLIPGLYIPQEGEILIDDQDIGNIGLRALRQKIAIVPQDVFLFSTSIKDNIKLGKPDAIDEEIIVATIKANADGFIRQLPHGYDTEVGERGVKLSGGQRQRIAIARAILKEPRILILDEATSNLDSESERLIQEALLNITFGRTTIVIAHRLSTVLRAEKIILLEQGKIAAEGRHEDLIKTNQLYHDLYANQFKDA